jgi:hypothetical protein
VCCRHADYCKALVRVLSQACYVRDWAADTEESRLWGPTTDSRNGRQWQRHALIREKRPTPTLFHTGPTHCTEDTMLPLRGPWQLAARDALSMDSSIA